MVNNILAPGYLFFDGFKYITTNNLQGPKGDKGDQGIQGPAGTIAAGNYTLSGPLNLDGYITLGVLHTVHGLTSDGYITLNGITNINTPVNVNSGNFLIKGTASLEIGSGGAGSFTINNGASTIINSNPLINGVSTFAGNVNLNGITTVSSNFHVNNSGSSTFDSNITVGAAATIFIDGDAEFNNTTNVNNIIQITSGAILDLQSGSTLFAASGSDISLGSDLQMIGANIQLIGHAALFGRNVFKTGILPDSDGTVDPIAGNIWVCTTTVDRNKTILDSGGSLDAGNWLLLANRSANTVNLKDPGGGLLIAITTFRWALAVKIGSAWTLIADGTI